jgi:hypothetical protein
MKYGCCVSERHFLILGNYYCATSYTNYRVSNFNNFEEVLELYKKNIKLPLRDYTTDPSNDKTINLISDEEFNMILDIWNQYKGLV